MGGCVYLCKRERCGYKGPETLCNKTFEDCRAKGNEIKFLEQEMSMDKALRLDKEEFPYVDPLEQIHEAMQHILTPEQQRRLVGTTGEACGTPGLTPQLKALIERLDALEARVASIEWRKGSDE